MLRVAGCLTQDHDLGLVALAALVCLLATFTSARLLQERDGDDPRRWRIRTAASAVAFGTGVWNLHFISILAFRPTVPFGFDLPMCILSLIVMIGAASIAFTIRPAVGGTPQATLASGLIVA